MRRQDVEIGWVSAAREHTQAGLEKCAAAAVEQIRVVEVDVDEPRQLTPRESASEITERVRRGDHAELPAGGKVHHAQLPRLGPALAVVQIRRTARTRRAIDVPEPGARLRHVGVRVPASAAEDRRREPERFQPPPVGIDACPGRLVTICCRGGGRARMVRSRPVGVVAERSTARGVSCALRPGALVLTGGRLGRAHERRDRESAGPRLLQRREAGPHTVVERSLNVAGHDRVPFPAHLRRLYRHPYAVLAVAAGVPRLGALLYERGRILEAYTDKSDDFALTFLDSGTYGFIPGIPSAYTQPLYGFFLIPIYWVERSWTTVGAAQIAVAIVTAWIVFAIGRRVASDGVALGGALLATLHPYLVWHDIHLNREVLDGLLAAAIVLTALVAAERERSLWWSVALGGTLGLAILGNARLLVLPLVLGVWLMARLGFAQHGLAALLVVCSCAALVLAPWVVRNRQSVGCLAITTDSRALWKANNLNTYDVLARGGWIDDVPPFPGSPPSPQDAGEIYRKTGRIVRVDECEQMRFFREQVVEFWREHPGEKARLAGQAARLLWQPNVLETEGRSGAGTWRDTARSTVEPIFMIVLYVFAVVGLFALPRSFVVLTAILLGYQTVIAMLFAGATRYRVPWDFLVAILAAAGIGLVVERSRRRGYSPASARS